MFSPRGRADRQREFGSNRVPTSCLSRARRTPLCASPLVSWRSTFQLFSWPFSVMGGLRLSADCQLCNLDVNDRLSVDRLVLMKLNIGQLGHSKLFHTSHSHTPSKDRSSAGCDQRTSFLPSRSWWNPSYWSAHHCPLRPTPEYLSHRHQLPWWRVL